MAWKSQGVGHVPTSPVGPGWWVNPPQVPSSPSRRPRSSSARRPVPVPSHHRHYVRPRFIHEGRIMEHDGSVFQKLTDPSLYTGSHKARFDAQGRGRGVDGHDSGTLYAVEALASTMGGDGAPFGGDDRGANRWASSLRSTFYSQTVDRESRMRRQQLQHEREVANRYRDARRAIASGYNIDGSVPAYEKWVLDPVSGELVLEERLGPPLADYLHAQSSSVTPQVPYELDRAAYEDFHHPGAPQSAGQSRTPTPPQLSGNDDDGRVEVPEFGRRPLAPWEQRALQLQHHDWQPPIDDFAGNEEHNQPAGHSARNINEAHTMVDASPWIDEPPPQRGRRPPTVDDLLAAVEHRPRYAQW